MVEFIQHSIQLTMVEYIPATTQEVDQDLTILLTMLDQDLDQLML